MSHKMRYAKIAGVDKPVSRIIYGTAAMPFWPVATEMPFWTRCLRWVSIPLTPQEIMPLRKSLWGNGSLTGETGIRWLF